MSKSWIVWLLVILVIAGGVYYWMNRSNGVSNYNTNTSMSTSTDNSGASTTGNVQVLTLNTGNSSALGTYLVAANGMTLYKYTPDTANKSNCTGQCAVIWPPYTVTSLQAASLVGGAGISGTIGVITRADGSLQVTYKGMPLYFYTKDKNPGDTVGQGVAGIWFVVAP